MLSTSNTLRISSNTLCISGAACAWSAVQADMVQELSKFGEIAALDMSLATAAKRILVTYFDVRCAQRALLGLAGCTEPVPPTASECRTVRVALSAFATAAAAHGDLARFGEVARLSVLPPNAVVEFYDLRSAQALLRTAARP